MDCTTVIVTESPPGDGDGGDGGDGGSAAGNAAVVAGALGLAWWLTRRS